MSTPQELEKAFLEASHDALLFGAGIVKVCNTPSGRLHVERIPVEKWHELKDHAEFIQANRIDTPSQKS